MLVGSCDDLSHHDCELVPIFCPDSVPTGPKIPHSLPHLLFFEGGSWKWKVDFRDLWMGFWKSKAVICVHPRDYRMGIVMLYYRVIYFGSDAFGYYYSQIHDLRCDLP